jgi:exodeoxyribonuclease VII large subunit
LASHLSLSKLAASVRRMFDHHFGDKTYWVTGEISSYKVYGGRNHYFDLIEKGESSDTPVAKFSAIMWANTQEAVRKFENITGQKLGNGIEVLVKVRVGFTEQYGLKLTVDDLDPSFTIGQMERKRRETLQKLVAQCPTFIRLINGKYITLNQGVLVPQVINRIALITSKEAAGFQDFEHTLKHNRYGYAFSIDYFFCRVQGNDAARMMSRRLAEIAVRHRSMPYDIVVLVRGGGAQTDLFVYDDFALNKEIARCEVPIWTGIGHLRDQTIADLFCHTSLKTPTAVAEAIISQNMHFEQALLEQSDAVFSAARNMLDEHRNALRHASLILQSKVPNMLHVQDIRLTGIRNKLDRTATALFARKKEKLARLANVQLIRSGERMIQQQSFQLANTLKRLTPLAERMLKTEDKRLLETRRFIIPAAGRIMENEKKELENKTKLVALSDPKKLLKRGYAIVYQEGRIVRSGQKLKAGSQLDIQLYDEQLEVAYQKTTKKADKSQ